MEWCRDVRTDESSDGRNSLAGVRGILMSMRHKGVRIWIDNDRLRYQAAKGTLTSDDIASLRAARFGIIDFLRHSSDYATAEHPLGPRAALDPVPLTFTQQLLWSTSGLSKYPSMRAVFTAVRLSGPLRVDFLKESFGQLVGRHESLRTRIAIINGDQHQLVDDRWQGSFEVLELAGACEKDRESTASSLIANFVSDPVDVTTDALFEVRLLKLNEQSHVLLVMMDHLIADAISVGILLREVWTMYAQLVRGEACSLPAMAAQFPDYAVWQRKTSRHWTDCHAAYWRDKLADAGRVRVFMERDPVPGVRPQFDSVPIVLDPLLSQTLSEVSKQHKTTLAMSVLCAYVALIFRWSNEMDIVIPFMTTGRQHPEIENTIGFFASRLFLRIRASRDDSLLDLLHRATEAYGAAYEHNDCGRIAAQLPAPTFLGNPTFNWFSGDLRVHPTAFTASGGPWNSKELGFSMEPFVVAPILPNELGDYDQWCAEPLLLLSDTPAGITGRAVYRLDCISAETMKQLVRNLRLVLETLLVEPNTRVRDVTLARLIG